MQITINIPDDLPTALVNQQVIKFEEKLKMQSKAIQQPISRWKKWYNVLRKDLLI